MKKKLIYAAVVSALLAGCGGSDDNKGDTSSYLDYLLTGSNAVRPSALAARASDGTLKFSTETADLSNPVSAMSTLDGWSTTQAIQIVPVTSSGIQVQAPTAAEFSASVAPLYLLELAFDSAALRPNGVKKVLTYGVDFVVAASAGKLNLVPLKPLNPSSYYMIVATDSLKDSTGSPVRAGSDYSNYKNNAGSNAQEQTINGLIALQEGLFKAATGIATDHVIFSDWFGTQSGADVLVAVKGAAASVVLQGLDAAKVWKQDALGNTSLPGTYTLAVTGNDDFLTLLDNEQFLPQEQKDAIAAAVDASPTLTGIAGMTKVYTGTVKLPYFLSSPATAGSWSKAKTQSWHGAIPSLYAIANALKASDSEVIAGLVGAGVDPALLAELMADPTRQSELLAEASKLVGVTLTSGGKPLDAEQNIGRFNPLPALEEVQSVPMRIFAKDALNTITDVIIYQHGVTSVKENAYALALGQIGAGIAASKNVAVVVIDHPLHGERGFALSGSMATVTTSDNPTPYLNLSYLTVARDNLKQSVADLLGLRMAVGLANSQNAIGSAGNLKVHFLGHSLGAIAGANLLAVANQPIGNPTADALFKFDTGGLAMPGGGIAPLLLNSPTFGPTIKMGVLTGGSAELKAAFTAYAPNCQTAVPTCFVNEFLPSLGATTQAAAASTLQSYNFAAQSVLDSADPINLASGIKADFPLFATEIVGDGALSLSDQVIPNSIASAPLGGTEPLFKLLALQPLTATGAANHHAARFVAGGHSSLLAPDENFDPTGDVTTEMQTQFGSFFMSGGTAVQVTDSSLLKQ
ncbi:TPA: VolA/Pla-1 family phospholipase [Aeromonas salmonicida subsp. salmonicida]|uniref:VolA/Pla-1 family phospholipase n=1 Tax=Aeromonas salmonicida TaxID=645 RepID=UPI00131F49EE|nr:VolA/Pla-1 family phospholipase [Aeromonas salmonicida]ELI6418840.1 lipase [Aeromonas salmonicida subsp. salmonicida]ELM3647282.1 lipase [Aeromonas salmonicida subsp. salmonicida]QHE44094.1 lipase [Aeromonas salmonicida subsp. salmonicida]QHE49521.1 lipase [Aeromonas salmonicida subsp. salmonicida]QJF56976.1 lipase [Aeromonas salmonicida subsp. salmonicida]